MELSLNITEEEVKKNRVTTCQKSVDPKKNRKKIFKIFLSSLLVLLLGTLIYFLYKGYKITKDVGFSFSPGELININKEPELRKDSSGIYTNVLIVGIDTREKGNLLNTDVLIVGSYNHESKDFVMISVPRDFHAQIDPTKLWFNKINACYMVNEQKKKGSGLDVLETVVEDVVGMEIQYHIMVDFKAFVNLIDAVGGVYVNVENSFTDHMYPLGTKYQTVSFTAGPQLMDGDTALKYSRSRHSRQHGEGSDYARARRQQKVIDAFKSAILSSETLLNPSKLMALFSSVQDNVKTSQFNIEDIQAGINILKDIKDGQTSSTYSFVLDPTAGNYSLISTDVVKNAGYAIAPKEGLGQYSNINEYVQLILKYPKLYSENPSINIYDTGLGYQNTYSKSKDLKEEYPYLNIKFMGTKYGNKEQTYIYSNEEGKFSASVEILSKYLNTKNTTKPEYILNKLGGGDITILMGKELTQDTISKEE